MTTQIVNINYLFKKTKWKFCSLKRQQSRRKIQSELKTKFQMAEVSTELVDTAISIYPWMNREKKVENNLAMSQIPVG